MKTQTIIGEIELKRADNFFTRLKGLLGSKELTTTQALLISPCSSVHTIGMKYAIHVLCLNKSKTIVAIRTNLKPNQFFIAPKGTNEIVEFSVTNQLINNQLIGHQFYIGDKQ